MKIRFYLSIFLVFVYFCITGLVSFYNSPLAGVANAQQATDTIIGYTFSKFVSEGYFNSMSELFFWLILFLLWVPWFFGFHKTNKNS